MAAISEEAIKQFASLMEHREFLATPLLSCKKSI
jgi:hypothetical protein